MAGIQAVTQYKPEPVISYNDESAYRDEVQQLAGAARTARYLYVDKTKEMVVEKAS